MTKIKVKKTLNLRRFSVRASEIIRNWKIVVPTIISAAGLMVGAYTAKGEGWVYSFADRYIRMFLTDRAELNFASDIVLMFLLPTLLSIILFFCGLSVFGGFISNVIPFLYSFFIGVVSHFFYINYTLKGLAYCVILIFPYTVFSLFSLILMTGECINMSEYLISKTSQRNKMFDYNLKFYYINFFKSYVFIIIAVLIKCVLDSLFIGIFSF